MPTAMTGYACDLCKAIHETELRAAQCEEKHGTFEVARVEWERGKFAPSAIILKARQANGEVREISYY